MQFVCWQPATWTQSFEQAARNRLVHIRNRSLSGVLYPGAFRLRWGGNSWSFSLKFYSEIDMQELSCSWALTRTGMHWPRDGGCKFHKKKGGGGGGVTLEKERLNTKKCREQGTVGWAFVHAWPTLTTGTTGVANKLSDSCRICKYRTTDSFVSLSSTSIPQRLMSLAQHDAMQVGCSGHQKWRISPCRLSSFACPV
jgi:hypothetical protein